MGKEQYFSAGKKPFFPGNAPAVGRVAFGGCFADNHGDGNSAGVALVLLAPEVARRRKNPVNAIFVSVILIIFPLVFVFFLYIM